MRNFKTLKPILISILVGASIAFLTTLFEGLLNYLRGFDPMSAGIAGGIVKYLTAWPTTLRG